jgi:hypothetical protein
MSTLQPKPMGKRASYRYERRMIRDKLYGLWQSKQSASAKACALILCAISLEAFVLARAQFRSREM